MLFVVSTEVGIVQELIYNMIITFGMGVPVSCFKIKLEHKETLSNCNCPNQYLLKQCVNKSSGWHTYVWSVIRPCRLFVTLSWLLC